MARLLGWWGYLLFLLFELPVTVGSGVVEEIGPLLPVVLIQAGVGIPGVLQGLVGLLFHRLVQILRLPGQIRNPSIDICLLFCVLFLLKKRENFRVWSLPLKI